MAKSVLSEFPTSFKGDFVLPGDPDYERSLDRWAYNARRNARVVAFVKDAEDVSLALKFAKSNQLQVAVKGGGHSPAGASSVEGGLVVDLSKYLNGCRVDPDKKLGYVDGGAIWETVDKAAIQYGLASVGGTINHTGVGGLILGGGYGWLSGQYGLVLDNLVQATMVTADGDVVTASETENADLFWGIRGGGCNFGVCTEFVLQLHPQRRTVYAGKVFFPPSVLDKLAPLTAEWWNNGPSEKEAMAQVLAVPHRQPCIIIVLFYNGSEEEGRANFKKFLDMGPIKDLTAEIPYEELNAVQNDIFYHGQCVYLKGTAQRRPNYAQSSRLLAGLTDLAMKTEILPAVLHEYFPLAKITSVPSDRTAFRRDPTSNVIFMFLWKEDAEETTELARSTVRRLIEVVKEEQASAMTERQGMGYSNTDADSVVENGDHLGKAYDRTMLAFGENYPRLQTLKGKYDPEQVFFKWFPILPA